MKNEIRKALSSENMSSASSLAKKLFMMCWFMLVGALIELCVDHWRLGAWSVGRVTIWESLFCEIRMSESRKLAWYR